MNKKNLNPEIKNSQEQQDRLPKCRHTTGQNPNRTIHLPLIPIICCVFLYSCHEPSRVIDDLVKVVGSQELVDIICVVRLVVSDALAHAALIGEIVGLQSMVDRELISTNEVLAAKSNAESLSLNCAPVLNHLPCENG